MDARERIPFSDRRALRIRKRSVYESPCPGLTVLRKILGRSKQRSDPVMQRKNKKEFAEAVKLSGCPINDESAVCDAGKSVRRDFRRRKKSGVFSLSFGSSSINDSGEFQPCKYVFGLRPFGLVKGQVMADTFVHAGVGGPQHLSWIIEFQRSEKEKENVLTANAQKLNPEGVFFLNGIKICF